MSQGAFKNLTLSPKRDTETQLCRQFPDRPHLSHTRPWIHWGGHTAHETQRNIPGYDPKVTGLR